MKITQIWSPSQLETKSIQQKNKQQELLIDTQITESILTNNRVKMNINKGVIISKAKEQKIDNLSRKQEDLSNKAINNHLQ